MTTDWLNRVHFGDCLETLRRMPDGIVNTCVTSPPYFGLRDYGHPGQIGLEETPEQFITKLVEVFRDVRRVLRDDGTAWVNMGDSYATNPGKNNGNLAKWAEVNAAGGGNRAGNLDTPTRGALPGLKQKDLIGVPWMLAFALRADGWYLRQDIIWAKPNPMPESVTDRCTKSHEYIFLLSKSASYYYDHEAIKEPVTQSTVDRLAQNVEGQAGSDRVPGKTNGRMKAVGNVASFPHKGCKTYAECRRDEICGDAWHCESQARVVVDEASRKALRTGTESRHRSSIPGGQSMQAEPDGLRNKRSVWTVSTKPYSGAHFATFPEDLIEPCILAGAPAGGVVLDPFMGSGTTAAVATRLGRQWIGCELNPEYEPLQRGRLMVQTLGLELT